MQGVLILAVGFFLTLLFVPGLASGTARGLGWGTALIAAARMARKGGI